ncbi:hypothetical protein [Roseovarius sp.]|uniref:hypothetical protein n=1 Tax=Roseovarius sp. TaxID=1486281 RepID=UPI002605FCD5|nr:hypothetical protein [Roseovarius sp.]
MIKRLLTGAISALLFLNGPALAQSATCAPRDTVVERLASSYGETRQSMGLGANNVVIEIFASARSGSWTITETGTDGITCLVASGRAFEAIAAPLPSPGNDA